MMTLHFRSVNNARATRSQPAARGYVLRFLEWFAEINRLGTAVVYSQSTKSESGIVGYTTESNCQASSL